MGISKVSSQAHNIEYGRGDSFEKLIIVTDSDNLPVDITGCTFSLTVDERENPDDVSTRVFVVIGTIVDAENGKVEFAPTSTDTNIDPKSYFYDIEMISASSRKITLIKGKFIIVQDITK